MKLMTKKLATVLKNIALATTLTLGTSTAFAAPVNVNTADANVIAESLKGIGQSKANAIVSYREAHGEFTDIAGLTSVKGIGEKTIAKNKEDILF